jgi:hypothetical protein
VKRHVLGQSIVAHLAKLGHAPEVLRAVALPRRYGSEFVETVIGRYQDFHGLPKTGQLDAATVEHLNRPRCSHPDVMAATATCAWPIKTLGYFQSVQYPGVDPARVTRNYATACEQLNAVCGISLEPADSAADAHIVAVAGPIDGPWNILAESELPCGATATSVMHQTFDNAEQLDDATMVACMCHELGHALGLGHSTPGNLMAPILDPTITKPQPGDIAELQARYGAPAAAPNTSLPDASAIEFNLSIAEAGTYVLTLNPVLTKRE